MASAAVGIDLGTTYSCVVAYKDGCVTVIPDEDGNKLIPSVVAFQSVGGEIKKLVGREATENAEIDQSHVVTEVKRLMGRKFDDPVVQTNLKRWPFMVTADSNGNAQVDIHLDGHPTLHVSPEEISASILSKLKQMSEKHLGKVVIESVITVPAYFNEVQRKATMEAADLANLKVLAIINEPNACALAYGIQSKNKERRRILVVDVGSYTCNVALIEVVEENFTILASNEDNNLGGEVFVTNMVNYCVNQVKEKFGSEVTIGKRGLLRLRNNCEQIKCKLFKNPDPKGYELLQIDNFIESTDLKLSITRIKFEELNPDLFYIALSIVTSCLKEANLSISDINSLVLVGGSMRIPKLREMLNKMFEGKQLYLYIDPDEAIAAGAAVFAAQKLALCKGHMVFCDILPFSLGVGGTSSIFGITIMKDQMYIIIPKNSKIPCKGHRRMKTKNNNVGAEIENVVTRDFDNLVPYLNRLKFS